MRRTRAAAFLLLVSAPQIAEGLPDAGVLQLAPAGTTAAGAPCDVRSEAPVPAATFGRVRLSAAGHDGARQVVEVLRDGAGVVAFRTGVTSDRTAAPVTWDGPTGDAVALDGSWWALTRPVRPVAAPAPEPDRLVALGVDVVDATTGDPDGDGVDEVVVVFHRPFRETVVSGLLPDVAGVDAAGRSLHLGLYGTDLTQEWVAGTVFRPVSAVAACDGALGLAFASGVAATDRVATGASLWGGFGFTSLPGLPDLPGAGDPACADVDGDGRTEPVIIDRTTGGRTSP